MHRPKVSTAWTTASETDFIDGMGIELYGDKIVRDRKKCLLGYAKAFPLRVIWGAINLHEIREYIKATIKKEFDEDIII
jgi:hypothetical protein